MHRGDDHEDPRPNQRYDRGELTRGSYQQPTLARMVSMASSRSFHLSDRSDTTAPSPKSSPSRSSASSRLRLPIQSAESSSSAGPAGSAAAAEAAGRARLAGGAAAVTLATAADAVDEPLRALQRRLSRTDATRPAVIRKPTRHRRPESVPSIEGIKK